MTVERLIHLTVGTASSLRRHDERGLSQSTENVILLVGAVAIAITVIGLVTRFVTQNLVLTP
ncbi:MAG TPA: hypothetical protein PKX10_07180 [Propioniciclava tarda]|nr:hypothetical protein [Propioniciclava tarda]